MKKRLLGKGTVAVIAAGLMAAVSAVSAPLASYAAERPSYLKSVTYAGDDWVINFWNTEMDHLDEDMEQIAADGFNSIVLVIPWNEFQPKTNPIQYNDYAFQQLDQVMEAAGRHDLWVQLRVSYTWDYYNSEDCAARFSRLLSDNQLMEAWKDYVRKVYQTASAHDHYYGGFITWEDFWNYVNDSAELGSGSSSISEAKRIGYQSWLSEHYSLESLNQLYNPSKSFNDYSAVYIPSSSSPARKLFYEFYDSRLNGLLAVGQSVYPDLSMEVRLDVDAVPDGNDGYEGADHYATFPCGNASYTALMYSVSMGQAFRQEITADAALAMMTAQLAQVRAQNGDKPIYIDQLLYMDATEEYAYNAQLKQTERASYLMSLPTILKTYTNGYAVWTYRNYANNPLYNSEFALGDRGWQTNRVHFTDHDGSRMAYMDPRAQLTQKIEGRISGQKTHENHVRFVAESDQGSAVNITVALGTQRKTIQISGKRDVDLNFGRCEFDQISFSTDGYVYLDDISIYNFVQDGQLYGQDGEELSCLGAIRSLNAQLQ
jgi:hypothetical protein